LDESKDYYANLGVLPSIEPTALKAVYLALLKKYHPDVFKGSNAEAERITKQLNEAYSVIGDQLKRAEYDGLRQTQYSQGGDYGQDNINDGKGNLDRELELDWKFIIEYYPEVEEQRLHLNKISSSLSLMFQFIIITKKLAKDSKRISNNIRLEYLNRYFGKNHKIHRFVIQLLLANKHDAALEISSYIRLVGDISNNDADNFINKIKIKFKMKPTNNFLNNDLENGNYMIIIIFIILVVIVIYLTNN
jgi:curved DNA-binding protein CbpA